jgi:hypothetical protein
MKKTVLLKQHPDQYQILRSPNSKPLKIIDCNLTLIKKAVNQLIEE